MGIMDFVNAFINPILDTISAFGSFLGIAGDDAGGNAREAFSGGIAQNTSGGEIGVQMAEGGIVPARAGGTLATIGEAGVAEAVIPLSGDVLGMGALLGAVQNMDRNIQQLQLQVNIDGNKVADAVNKSNDRNNVNTFGTNR